MSSGDMRMQAFVNTLNQGLVTPVWKPDYEMPINNGFPILIWQNNLSTGVPVVETGHAPSLQVYPNPTKDEIFIKTDLQVKRVEIYSLTGALLLTENNFSGKISVSTLPQGVYMVGVYTSEGVMVSKVVKE